MVTAGLPERRALYAINPRLCDGVITKRRAVAAVTAAMEGGGRPSALQAALLAAGTGLTALLYSVYRQQARLARGLQVGTGAPGRGCGLLPAVVAAPGLGRGLLPGLGLVVDPRLLPSRRAPGGCGWTGNCGPCCWRRRAAACPMLSSKVLAWQNAGPPSPPPLWLKRFAQNLTFCAKKSYCMQPGSWQ